MAAVVLACAGLDRLGRSEVISERISPDLLLPAVCQGMLALESRTGAPLTQDLARLSAPEHVITATAERSFLTRLGGDCTVPLAAHCEILSAGQIRIRGLVASLDGREIASAEVEGDVADSARLGEALAEAVLEDGGRSILEALREGANGDSGP